MKKSRQIEKMARMISHLETEQTEKLRSLERQVSDITRLLVEREKRATHSTGLVLPASPPNDWWVLLVVVVVCQAILFWVFK